MSPIQLPFRRDVWYGFAVSNCYKKAKITIKIMSRDLFCYAYLISDKKDQRLTNSMIFFIILMDA